jgi:hypothetical protein
MTVAASTEHFAGRLIPDAALQKPADFIIAARFSSPLRRDTNEAHRPWGKPS